MKKYLVGATLFGCLALASTAASAAVVCNDEGDCWRTKERLAYPPDVSQRTSSSSSSRLVAYPPRASVVRPNDAPGLSLSTAAVAMASSTPMV